MLRKVLASPYSPPTSRVYLLLGEAFHSAPSLRKAFTHFQGKFPLCAGWLRPSVGAGALTAVPPARCEGTLLLSYRALRSGSYWNSRFKRCPNDLIKATEENAQAMRSCSSDEEVVAVLVLLCRGYGWRGQGKNLPRVHGFILFEQEKWIAVLRVLLNLTAGVEQLLVE